MLKKANVWLEGGIPNMNNTYLKKYWNNYPNISLKGAQKANDDTPATAQAKMSKVVCLTIRLGSPQQ